MSGFIDFTSLTTDLVDKISRNLYRELLLIRRRYPTGERPPEVLDMIDIFSADKILGMVKNYGSAVTSKASHFSDPIAAAERFQANRPFVKEVLVRNGYQDLVKDILWGTGICFEENREQAVARALSTAQKWRLHGKGRGKGPPPPTASAGGAQHHTVQGGGETDLVIAEGSPNGGGEKLERSILDISRGVGGFVTITAPFVGLDVAEHHHWISSGQKTLIVGGLMGAMTYLDRMTPGHLSLLFAPFEVGRIVSQKGLEVAGVESSSVWHKVGGTVGAFAGAEGFVTCVGKGAGAKTLGEAHVLGREILHDSLLNIGRNVQESLGVARDFVAKGWRMIAGSLPTAAEARMIGAALATGIANTAGTLITPLILPTDALSIFPQRRGPSI